MGEEEEPMMGGVDDAVDVDPSMVDPGLQVGGFSRYLVQL
jgi:hypothetical protein